MNLAYIFLMLTLGVNFFCFIYVTIIDRQKRPANGQGDALSVQGKRRPGILKAFFPVLLLLVFLMLLYMVFG